MGKPTEESNEVEPRREFEEVSTEDREKSVDMWEGKESEWGRPIRESLKDSEDLEDIQREMSDKSFDRESKDGKESAEDWEGEEKLREQKPDFGADELKQPKEEVYENADELTVSALEADEGSDLSEDQKSEKDFSEERVRDFMKKDKPIDQEKSAEEREESVDKEEKAYRSGSSKYRRGGRLL